MHMLYAYTACAYLFCLSGIPVPLFRNSVSSRCSFGCEADIILKNTLI